MSYSGQNPFYGQAKNPKQTPPQTIPAEEFYRVMTQMQEIMNRINQNLLSINDRICVLESRVDKISKETKKMDEHVDFVSNLYQQVKSPFHYLMSYVVSQLGNHRQEAEIQSSSAQLQIEDQTH